MRTCMWLSRVVVVWEGLLLATMNDESSFLPVKEDNTLTKEQMKDDLITLLDTVNTCILHM